MGYNTVAFILNDFVGDIQRSPKTALFRLTNPYCSYSEENRYENYSYDFGREVGEPMLSGQAIRMLPSFHSSERKFFMAGGNSIDELDVKGYGTAPDGRRTVTLILPKWFK